VCIIYWPSTLMARTLLAGDWCWQWCTWVGQYWNVDEG